MNYYELLQVTPSASAEVIKNAYKAMAKKYHPDLYQGNRSFAEEKMKLLNEAISILENEEKRREYNIENNFPDISGRGEHSDEFLKNIDDFLNYSDSSADINSPVPFDESDGEVSDEIKPLFDYEEELEKVKTSGRKSKPAIGKWYYIVIAGLIIANIAIVCLIIGNFSTKLLDSFLKKDNTGTGGEVSGEDFDDIEDYIEPQDWNDGWDDDIVAANGFVDIEPTQDFVETYPSGENEVPVSETTTEKAALTLPPTAPTTGKKLPAATAPKTEPATTTQAETTTSEETESETIPEYTEPEETITEESTEPLEFPSEEELTSETYGAEEAPGMKPEETAATDSDAGDEAVTDEFEELPT